MKLDPETMRKVMEMAGEAPLPEAVRKLPRRAPQLAAPALEVTLPVALLSEANARGHWTDRHGRFARQQAAVWATLASLGLAAGRLPLGPPAVLTLIRVGGRKMDPDNLAGAFKAVQDACCGFWGIDDGDDRLTIRYEQAPGRARGVRVRIESGGGRA